MSNFAPWTPGEIPDDYDARVAADTRNILEKTILRAMSTGFNSQGPSKFSESNLEDKENNLTQSQTVTDEEFKKFFPDNDADDDDDDDSEEIFQQIIKRAQETAKREMEMNKKNPLLAVLELNTLPLKTRRKRKSKAFEKSLEMMNKFRKTLVKPVEVCKPPEEKTVSTISTVNSSKVVSKTSVNDCIESNTKTVKVYPKWKTTATYTPIFLQNTNPNWINVDNLEESNKMYTPGQISSWMSSTNNCITDAPLSSANRSSVATTNSTTLKSSAKSITNKETPIDNNTVISSLLKRSSTVRFKSLSPEKISSNSNGISSISSRTMMDEYINHFSDSDKEGNDYYLPSKQNQVNNFYFTPINNTYEKNNKGAEIYTSSNEEHIIFNSSTPIGNSNNSFAQSPLEYYPLTDDNQSLISPIYSEEDDISINNLRHFNDKNHEYYSKQYQQHVIPKHLFETEHIQREFVCQEYEQKFNDINELSSNGSPLKSPYSNINESIISPITQNTHINEIAGFDDENHQYYSKHCQKYPEKNKFFKVHQEYKEQINYTNNHNSNELNKNVNNAPFIMQKFVNNLSKKLNNNYNMEVKCSMKLKQQLF